MASEHMNCPHCGAQLQKSAAAQVLGEMGRSTIIGAPETVSCPACGGSIDTQEMIRGKHDTSKWAATIGVICILVFIGGLIGFQSEEYGWGETFVRAFVITIGAGIALGILGVILDVLAWLVKRK